MNAGRVYTHTVRRGEADTPLLTLLTTNYSHSSALEWVEHISNGRVIVDGLPGTSEQRPHEGATIHYHRPPWIEPPAPIAELKVLHDDGALVVLHKPSGLPVLPSELYYEHSVLRRLHHSRPSDAVAPHPAHRLGVGTSGLLLCAVGGPARAALSQAFERRKVKKTYRALVVGHVARARQKSPDEADNKRRKIEGHGGGEGDDAVASPPTPPFDLEIHCPIGPVPHTSWAGTVHGALPNGGDGAKDAHSRVRVLEHRSPCRQEDGDDDEDDADIAAARSSDEQACTLVEVEIPTGRAHQIRIHMAYAGHPLVGDPLYMSGGTPRESSCCEEGNGEKTASRPPLPRDGGYLLHAWRALLPHPVTGEMVTFTAAPPPRLRTESRVRGEPPM